MIAEFSYFSVTHLRAADSSVAASTSRRWLAKIASTCFISISIDFATQTNKQKIEMKTNWPPIVAIDENRPIVNHHSSLFFFCK